VCQASDDWVQRGSQPLLMTRLLDLILCTTDDESIAEARELLVPDNFFDTVWGRRPLHLPGTIDTRGLLSAPEMLRLILDEFETMQTRVVLYPESQNKVTLKEFFGGRPSRGEFLAKTDKQLLRFRNVHEWNEPSRHFVAAFLNDALGGQAPASFQMNSFMVRPMTFTLPHRDPHVIAIGGSGSKFWRIYRDEALSDYVEYQLREGDFLYIPPNTIHDVTTPILSTHHTIVFEDRADP
jgi:hypothetical protein